MAKRLSRFFAPDDFGKFSGDLLVGNFGNGRIHAFDPTMVTGRGEFQHRGPLHSAGGPPIAIEGLWGLAFGNGGNAGPKDVLFFTAGPSHEEHGLLANSSRFRRLAVSAESRHGTPVLLIASEPHTATSGYHFSRGDRSEEREELSQG